MGIVRLIAALVFALSGPVTAVVAQEFPSRPIRMIIPFPPGGPNDIVGRVVGQKMSEILGQPVIVENRAGAGGVTGTDAVAKADGDGYTIGVVSAGALAISSSLVEKIPYDPVKDVKPITLCAKLPEMLVVATSVPANNLQELVALAKSKPGQLNFASSGPGGMPHLAGELMKMVTGIDIVHVPYRGAAPAVNDLLGQQVHMVFLDLPILLPQVQAGKLKPIVIGAMERSPALPNVPTSVEAGYSQIQVENWHGMIAPASTPPTIVAKLNKAAVEALRRSDVKEKLAEQGAAVVADSPEEFGAFIKSEIAKWRKVIKEANVKAN